MIELDVVGSGKTLVVGHRGAMGRAPENTMSSFEMGVALGADCLEMDIHESKDGEIVVIHDAAVDRTTDGTGRVASLSCRELKRLDAGAWFDPSFRGERIPRLAEVLEWAQGRVPLVIEVKGDPVPRHGIEEELLSFVDHHGMIGETMVISFHHETVRRVKELDPRIATGILYVCSLADTGSTARAARADSVRPQWSYLTPELVREAHADNLTVSTWTVDEVSDMEKVVALGVDSIATDYPGRLRTCLDRLGRSWRQ